MNITYLIGNGFDLSVGLNTRYCDFLEYYLGKDGPTDAVNRGKTIIRRQMSRDKDNWSDMESELGKLPTLFRGVNGSRNFQHLYDDLLTELSTFLSSQEQRIDFTRQRGIIASAIASALMKPYDFLQEELGSETAETWRTRMERTVCFSFLSFNYTTVFDQCLALMNQNGNRHEYKSVQFTENINPVIHIHGDLNSNMVLGVNDETQIGNVDNVAEEIRTKLVKPRVNMEVHGRRIARAEKYIAESQIIVTYGMSIGPTDRRWWNLLCEWLQGDESRQLIVYVRIDGYAPCNPGQIISKRKEIRERFSASFAHGELRSSELKRIHVACNRDFFTQRLVP